MSVVIVYGLTAVKTLLWRKNRLGRRYHAFNVRVTSITETRQIPESIDKEKDLLLCSENVRDE